MRMSLILVIFATGLAAPAARETAPSRPGDRMLARYFSAETDRLGGREARLTIHSTGETKP